MDRPTELRNRKLQKVQLTHKSRPYSILGRKWHDKKGSESYNKLVPTIIVLSYSLLALFPVQVQY